MPVSSYSDSRRLILPAAGSVVFIAAVTVVLWYVDSRGGGARELANSADPRQRHKAIDRLRGKSSDAARRTLRMLSGDRDKWVAISAVRALGDDRSDAARRVLAEILTDRDLGGGARGEAAEALGSFKHADPSLLTQTLTGDPDPEARAGAARGLLRMRNPEAIPQLVEALEDRDPRVRLWAITAIHKMIARRFGRYDARLPPEKQRHEIGRIKAYLRRCGVL